MEEPKKILRAHYLGCTQVSSATGMDTLNESVDRLAEAVPKDQWQAVNVSIAPSMISIHHPNVSTTSYSRFIYFYLVNAIEICFIVIYYYTLHILMIFGALKSISLFSEDFEMCCVP